VGVVECVAYQDTVFKMLEDHLLAQDDTSDTVDGGGHRVAAELADIFVSVGTEVVALVLVQAKVELRTVLDDSAVERREQHMVLIVQAGDRNDKQPMVLAGVAVDNRGAGVGSRPVGPEDFFAQRVLQVGHQRSFESKITHSSQFRLLCGLG
jgi:choline dehydrogenase-like flavoprotein